MLALFVGLVTLILIVLACVFIGGLLNPSEPSVLKFMGGFLALACVTLGVAVLLVFADLLGELVLGILG